MKSLKRIACWGLVMAVLLTSSVGCSGLPGSGGSDLAFFKGKTVTIIVPHGAGGGMDAYARMIAPYLQKYLPGSNVDVQNVSEGGGTTGRNRVYAAQPDGLTLGLTTGAGLLFAEWAELAGVQYKGTNFSWVGRISTEPHVMVVSARSQNKTMDGIIKAKKLTMGFSGLGSDDYYVALIAAKTLGYQVETNTKFAGSNEANAACAKGEVDAVQLTYGSIRPLIDAKTVLPVVVFSSARMGELPTVPTILELASGEAQKTMMAIIGLYELDRVMFAPPAMSASRLKVLRDALDKAMADPELKQTSDKLKRPTQYLTGSDVDKLLENIKAAQDQLKPLVKEIGQSSQ